MSTRFTTDGVSLYARTGQVAFVGRHGEVSFSRDGNVFKASFWAPGVGEMKTEGTARDAASWVNNLAKEV